MALPLESVRRVQQIICHRNAESPCPDGVASALILRAALPDALVRFASHDEAVAAEPGMLFCGVTPHLDVADDHVAVGTLVLDHHRSARELVTRFGPRGVFADEEREPGISGAVLAFREVWKPILLPSPALDGPDGSLVYERAMGFARLAGIRDTWQKKDSYWEAACAQAEALRFWPWKSWPRGPFGTNHEVFANMLMIGGILVAKARARARDLADQVVSFWTPSDKRVAIVPSVETSDVAELVDADLLVGFAYGSWGTTTLRLSFRSRGEYDCAALAAHLGGGGHKNAAGATLHAVQSYDPWAQIVRDVNSYDVKASCQTAR